MSRNRRHVVEALDGSVQIIQCNSEDNDLIHEWQLTKTLFELSRDGSDMLTHFDVKVHTRAALAQGITGHISITETEVDVSTIPASRDQRKLWSLVNGQVIPNGPEQSA